MYAGRFYAFTIEGDILTFNWDRLIDHLPFDQELRVPLEYAFQKSNLLYLESSLRDPDVKRIMFSKFSHLAEMSIQLNDQQLIKASVSKQRSPFEFPHSDSTIYREAIYIVSQSGVFRATCNKKTRYGISTKVEKYWDASVFQLAASYDRLALAAGDEGLFELAVGGAHILRNDPKLIAAKRCTSCSWAFHSIYGSSHESTGFLADYDRDRKGRSFIPNIDEKGRWLRKIIPSDDIFHEHGFSWAAQDRICLANNGEVKVNSYAPFQTDKRIESLGTIEVLQSRHGRVIAGAVALFGTIIEYENVLVVCLSDGTIWKTDEEIVSWRVFPRSRNYENQLHIIYDDRLEVLSFNNDYFVDQKRKIAGITYINREASRWKHQIEYNPSASS
ncbi:MAG TPA: hypothetical protein VFR24_18395 [Candidatus Angelobacter sp.]|nr:hypothetical protein [Candidatus Angelobacter sp.]